MANDIQSVRNGGDLGWPITAPWHRLSHGMSDLTPFHGWSGAQSDFTLARSKARKYPQYVVYPQNIVFLHFKRNNCLYIHV